MHMIPGRWRRWLLILALAPAPVALSAPHQVQPGKESIQPKYSEEWFISGKEKTKIKVGQYLPGEGTGPFPGIVLLHGIDGLDLLPTNLQVQFLYGTVANRMARQGYVVHFVHYFHRTPLKREEIPKVKEELQKQLLSDHSKIDPKLVQYYHDWLDTCRDAVQFLQKHEDVDRTKTGVVGLSLGGFLATSLAVKYPELNITVLGNLFGGLPPSLGDVVRQNKMKLPPILIMAGEEDDVVPERFQRELFLLWRETGNLGEAHFYGDYGHGFYDKRTKNYDQSMALNEALPTALRFLKRHLPAQVVEKK
jgi:dienelactone hydrolase